MKKTLLVLLCCLAVAFIGCTGSSRIGPYNRIPFEIVLEGCLNTEAPHDSPSPYYWEALATYVIENQDDLEALWAAYEIPHPLPTVDFGSRTAVAFFEGQRWCGSCWGEETYTPGTEVVKNISVTQTESCASIGVEANSQCLDCTGGFSSEIFQIISIPKPDTGVFRLRYFRSSPFQSRTRRFAWIAPALGWAQTVIWLLILLPAPNSSLFSFSLFDQARLAPDPCHLSLITRLCAGLRPSK
jgi:hypothetical protein